MTNSSFRSLSSLERIIQIKGPGVIKLKHRQSFLHHFHRRVLHDLKETIPLIFDIQQSLFDCVERAFEIPHAPLRSPGLVSENQILLHTAMTVGSEKRASHS